MYYSRSRKRIKEDIWYIQYYNELGDIGHLQLLLSVQLLTTPFEVTTRYKKQAPCHLWIFEGITTQALVPVDRQSCTKLSTAM